ncbi:MAG: D-alanine aminotransferase [Hyphobacterium sp.]|nr:MAG: D-alanine aminotransferase [Hyphobacterium sp.]
MSRFAYVNGQYIRHTDARIHIEDRGNQFSDAVYEVWGVRNGELMDFDGHLRRLARSLGELKIRIPMAPAALTVILHRMVALNKLRNGLIYLQVSRGQARRDHAFPAANVRPGIMITAKSTNAITAETRAEKGISVITQPDIRWGRRDIKSISLLPNVLAKQAASEAGASECWLVDPDGFITEGASSNAWIMTTNGVLVTRPANTDILNGITRRTLFELAESRGIPFEERAFSREEALCAREAFVTSASAYLTPVVEIDGKPIGNGHPGTFSLQLREAYVATTPMRSRGRPVRDPVWLVAHRLERLVG